MKVLIVKVIAYWIVFFFFFFKSLPGCIWFTTSDSNEHKCQQKCPILAVKYIKLDHLGIWKQHFFLGCCVWTENNVPLPSSLQKPRCTTLMIDITDGFNPSMPNNFVIWSYLVNSWSLLCLICSAIWSVIIPGSCKNHVSYNIRYQHFLQK